MKRFEKCIAMFVALSGQFSFGWLAGADYVRGEPPGWLDVLVRALFAGVSFFAALELVAHIPDKPANKTTTPR